MALSNKSILEKVNFLLSLAAKGEYSNQELKKVVDMAKEHTDNIILGRVFGYSVSDYAIADLSWLGTEETVNIFNSIYEKLPLIRQKEVSDLINSKLYLEY